MNLFEDRAGAASSSAGSSSRPLAERMRPQTLDEYVGQRHLLDPDKALRRQIESGNDRLAVVGHDDQALGAGADEVLDVGDLLAGILIRVGGRQDVQSGRLGVSDGLILKHHFELGHQERRRVSDRFSCGVGATGHPGEQRCRADRGNHQAAQAAALTPGDRFRRKAVM